MIRKLLMRNGIPLLFLLRKSLKNFLIYIKKITYLEEGNAILNNVFTYLDQLNLTPDYPKKKLFLTLTNTQ